MLILKRCENQLETRGFYEFQTMFLVGKEC